MKPILLTSRSIAAALAGGAILFAAATAEADSNSQPI